MDEMLILHHEMEWASMGLFHVLHGISKKIMSVNRLDSFPVSYDSTSGILCRCEKVNSPRFECNGWPWKLLNLSFASAELWRSLYYMHTQRQIPSSLDVFKKNMESMPQFPGLIAAGS